MTSDVERATTKEGEAACPGLEVVLRRWTAVAAAAWQGHAVSGRGTVTVAPEGAVTYTPGASCRCHRALVERYDPETQVVVVVHAGAAGCIHLVEGWPPPREAWETAAADVVGATVQ